MSIEISFGICFKKGKTFQKPSWKLRGEFLQGSFYLVKGKAFEIGGGISNLKMILEIIFLYLWLFAKEFEKICKNKQVVVYELAPSSNSFSKASPTYK
jgi:hypothetical protein